MANILITGCRGGIGLDVACKLLKRGHKVYATVHRENSVDDLRVVLKQYGENFVVEKLDIAKANDINKTDEWNIDVLINNAAVGDSGPLAEIDPERVKAVFNTSLFSTLQLTQRVLPKMIAKGYGRILFMGSVAGHVPTPFYAPYAMTTHHAVPGRGGRTGRRDRRHRSRPGDRRGHLRGTQGTRRRGRAGVHRS